MTGPDDDVSSDAHDTSVVTTEFIILSLVVIIGPGADVTNGAGSGKIVSFDHSCPAIVDK